jgi:myo-inositol 2-dehydrogenase/D-chiro-inositol 1-dehydrogenase
MKRVALVGAGRIGRIHAANAAAHPELELAYVVDPNAASAAAITSATGAKRASLEQALADESISGVIIASSTDTHLDYCLSACAVGKAIFCEKPIDQDLKRARDAEAKLGKARLFLGFNRRFDPNFQRLQGAIANGAMGRLESLQITSNDPEPPPVTYLKVSGGLFKDMAIHDFDMCRWLLGEEPTEVFAVGSCLVDSAIGEAGDVDTARTILKTQSGRLCVIANSRRSGFGYDQRIEGYCSGGLITAANMTETTVQVWTEAGARSDSFQNFFLDRYKAAYVSEMAHFADILSERATPSITFRDGVAALGLAEAAATSMRSGLPVRLDAP